MLAPQYAADVHSYGAFQAANLVGIAGVCNLACVAALGWWWPNRK